MRRRHARAAQHCALQSRAIDLRLIQLKPWNDHFNRQIQCINPTRNRSKFGDEPPDTSSWYVSNHALNYAAFSGAISSFTVSSARFGSSEEK